MPNTGAEAMPWVAPNRLADVVVEVPNEDPGRIAGAAPKRDAEVEPGRVPKRLPGVAAGAPNRGPEEVPGAAPKRAPLGRAVDGKPVVDDPAPKIFAAGGAAVAVAAGPSVDGLCRWRLERGPYRSVAGVRWLGEMARLRHRMARRDRRDGWSFGRVCRE